MEKKKKPKKHPFTKFLPNLNGRNNNEKKTHPNTKFFPIFNGRNINIWDQFNILPPKAVGGGGGC